jgi:hypothetical protein
MMAGRPTDTQQIGDIKSDRMQTTDIRQIGDIKSDRMQTTDIRQIGDIKSGRKLAASFILNLHLRFPHRPPSLSSLLRPQS